jgi:hypothetical protein
MRAWAMGQHVKICVLHQFFEVFLHVATLVEGEVVVTNAVYCVRLTNEYKSYSIRQRKNITHKLRKHAGTVFAHCFVFRYSCCQKSQDSHTTYGNLVQGLWTVLHSYLPRRLSRCPELYTNQKCQSTALSLNIV